MEITITATKETLFIKNKIGFVKNNWRLRNIEIWEHPTDKNKVVTIGRGFNGGSNANCIEERFQWEQYIGKYNTVLN
jgi:hypothetical protein